MNEICNHDKIEIKIRMLSLLLTIKGNITVEPK